MSTLRLVAVITTTVLATALLMSAITRPARADTPKTAECKSDFVGTSAAKYTEAVQAWMTAELAAGRTGFLFPSSSLPVICAW